MIRGTNCHALAVRFSIPLGNPQQLHRLRCRSMPRPLQSLGAHCTRSGYWKSVGVGGAEIEVPLGPLMKLVATH